jgi:hypothetical protein
MTFRVMKTEHKQMLRVVARVSKATNRLLPQVQTFKTVRARLLKMLSRNIFI